MTPATALLITGDDLLREDLHRLAAAAGTSLEVARTPSDAMRSWAVAGVVLVGADVVHAVARQRPARRDAVHVVGRGLLPDDSFRSALAVGALDVVELPGAEGWLVELLTDAGDAAGVPGRPGSSGVRRPRTLGVVGGSGGVGATTFACALALVAGGTGPAALLDLDPLGPGVDRVVGLEDDAGARWDALTGSHGRLGSTSLRSALPQRGGLAVLTWSLGRSPVSLDAATVREVLSASQRGNQVVVLDLPRALDAVTAEVATRCDQVLVVAGQSVAGVASAGKVTALLGPLNGRLGLVARGGRSAVPATQVAQALGLPLVAEVPDQRRLGEHLDLGLGPVHPMRSPLRRAATAALAAVREPELAG